MTDEEIPRGSDDSGHISPEGAKTAATECAEQLVLIARDLRLNGDIGLVKLDEDGVAPAPITLADELWLIAMRLDADRVMAMGREDKERRG